MITLLCNISEKRDQINIPINYITQGAIYKQYWSDYSDCELSQHSGKQIMYYRKYVPRIQGSGTCGSFDDCIWLIILTFS